MQPRPSILIALVVLFLAHPVQAGSEPFWIWHGENAGKEREMFARRKFHVSNRVRSAELRVAGAGDTGLFLNGKPLAAKDGAVDVTSRLRLGRNVLATHAKSGKGRSGFIALLVVTLQTGQRHIVATGRDWKASPDNSPNWHTLGFDDSRWPDAKALAPHGAAPCGNVLHRD